MHLEDSCVLKELPVRYITLFARSSPCSSRPRSWKDADLVQKKEFQGY
jgi:hypothetical protein